MGNISHNQMLIRNTDIPTVMIDQEVGMMNAEKGKYFTLDPIGSKIWAILEEPKCLQDIVSELTKEYNVDEKTCQEDVLELLEKLYTEKLVRFYK